jgi:ribose transport system substrate-binding protein
MTLQSPHVPDLDCFSDGGGNPVRLLWRGQKTAAVGLLCLSGALAACSSTPAATTAPASQAPATQAPASEPAASSEAGGQPVPTIHNLSDIKLAYFAGGSGNAYIAQNEKGVKDAAAKAGLPLQEFNANWDPKTQADQAQNALTSNAFNAWVFAGVDQVQTCNYVKQGIAAGILVSIPNQGACSNQAYMPGTVTFTGGQTEANYEAWFDYIFSRNPDAKFALITGPNLNYNTLNAEAALQKMQAKYPNVKVVANQQLDYTTETANKAAVDILQANPDLTVIASNYSEPTAGIVQAIKAANKSGQIKVYDVGGSQWALDAVKSGDIEMTYPLLPYDEFYQATQAIFDLVQGKPVPEFIDMSKQLKFDGAPWITKDNADKFTPQF